MARRDPRLIGEHDDERIRAVDSAHRTPARIDDAIPLDQSRDDLRDARAASALLEPHHRAPSTYAVPDRSAPSMRRLDGAAHERHAIDLDELPSPGRAVFEPPAASTIRRDVGRGAHARDRAGQPAARAVAHRLELADDRERLCSGVSAPRSRPDRRVQPADRRDRRSSSRSSRVRWPDRANRCSERATSSAIAARAIDVVLVVHDHDVGLGGRRDCRRPCRNRRRDPTSASARHKARRLADSRDPRRSRETRPTARA